jgi:hypothetical protein
MAVIVLTSAAGAPGVTSTAVGLTLTWKRSVILVDADPAAHQAILAGYLRGQISTGKGMQRVAEAHRDRRPLVEVVSDETIPLSAGPGPVDGHGAGDDTIEVGPSTLSRRLLPGFSNPANAALFDPVWPDLTDTFVEYEAVGIDVIIDAGRLDPRAGLPQPVVERADAVCLITRSDLRSIAASRGAVLRLREQIRLTGNDSNLGLVLLGDNDPYGRREIGNLLSVPVVSVVASEPQSARVFSDGARRGRKFGRSELVRSLHRVGDDLTAQVRRRRSRLGLDPDRMDHDRLRPSRFDSVRGDPDDALPNAIAGVHVATAPSVNDSAATPETAPAEVASAPDGTATEGASMNAWLRAGADSARGGHV